MTQALRFRFSLSEMKSYESLHDGFSSFHFCSNRFIFTTTIFIVVVKIS